jgi:preprotein translocase subunit SecD
VAPPAAGQFRPARYLASFLFIVALLYALVFATGDHKPTPKLGIDLQGGTRVALTARSEKGTPDRDQLNEARKVIDNRVNKIGVSGAEVILDGQQIIITVPGEGGDQAKSLGQTGKMNFRPVLGSTAAQPPPQQQTPQPNPTTSANPPPSAGGGSPSSAPPQGRPAPAVAAQPTTSAQPPPAQPPAGQADPTADCAKYLTDLNQYTADTKAKNVSSIQVPTLIAEAKTCRQNKLLAPSADGTVQADQTLQQAALATLNCAKDAQDPLAGNDDPTLPVAACDQNGTEKFILGPSFLPGTDVTDANAQVDTQGVGYVVILDFNSDGGKKWGDYTTAHNEQSAPGGNNRAAFVLDTQVVSAPTIQEPIVGGSTRINGGSGGFKQSEARDLANVLKYGSLPLSFESSSAETVSATLGLASLRAGLIAGAIGLALVFVYCLFYYRLLGVLTILSLMLSGLIVYALLVLLGRAIGFTLDLPGIAGFIVAIGITADSFVIFFERLKDEVREGRTFRSAVPRAWVRARRTVLSADAVVFLASAVLYIIAVGQVQGFAFTLGMSTILDLIVVFLVTHPLVALASTSKTLSNPRFSGLGAVQRMAAAQRAAARTAVKEA